MFVSMTRLLGLISFTCLPMWAQAQGVKVEEAWARATVAGQTAGGVFMTLRADTDAALVGARSPRAARAEIHEMALEGNVMKMRAVPRVALPAGKVVALKPGGHHVMLMGLSQPLKAGESLPIILQIEGADKKISQIEISATVRGPQGGPDSGQHHGHH